jgi:hypothetical protein
VAEVMFFGGENLAAELLLQLIKKLIDLLSLSLGLSVSLSCFYLFFLLWLDLFFLCFIISSTMYFIFYLNFLFLCQWQYNDSKRWLETIYTSPFQVYSDVLFPLTAWNIKWISAPELHTNCFSIQRWLDNGNNTCSATM